MMHKLPHSIRYLYIVELVYSKVLLMMIYITMIARQVPDNIRDKISKLVKIVWQEGDKNAWRVQKGIHTPARNTS